MSDHNWDELRDKIIGLGEQSARKSYFPELQKKITELEDRENNLRTLLNSMMDGVIILDNNARLVEVNAGMLRMYRMPDKETALTYNFMAYSQQVNEVMLNQIITETLSGIPQLLDWKARCPLTNDLFDAEISFHATRWNQIPAVIATVRDISFRKQMEQRLLERERMLMQQNEELRTLNEELAESNDCIAKMNEQLQKTRKKAIESDRLKSAFLANMSHEIRTPMNGIIGFASLLAFPDNDKDAMAQYVSIINNCSQQLLTIIDDIIDISKIESGQVTLTRRQVHLNTLMNELYAMYRASVNDEIDLIVENGFPDDNCMLLTDPDRLRQVINNLINNAVKFTPQGIITFGYRKNKKMLEFYVTDTGIGISPDHQAMIFKRFRQAESITHTTHGGTGLGLTISKALVRLMGGKIRVKSDAGSGSTFYFTHPLSIDDSD